MKRYFIKVSATISINMDEKFVEFHRRFSYITELNKNFTMEELTKDAQKRLFAKLNVDTQSTKDLDIFIENINLI